MREPANLSKASFRGDAPDRERIEAVKNPRRIEKHFLEGTAALVADLRHGVEAFVTTTRPGPTSKSGQARRAGTTTPAAQLERNWLASRRLAELMFC
jgi:hypothetical protein